MSSMISDKDVASFQEQGYFITKPAFSHGQLDSVKSEFERLWAENVAEAEKKGDAAAAEWARNRPFIGQTHTRSRILTEFVKSPVYLEACARLIGPDADLYYNQAVIKAPDKGKRFGWHQDSGYIVTSPLKYITCWTAITEATLDNGCCWIIPGSHKLGLVEHKRNEAESSLDCEADESKAVPVPVERGQVVVFSSLMLHKSGANTTKLSRHAYVPQYHVPRVVEEKTGQLTGDQFAVLRGGKPV